MVVNKSSYRMCAEIKKYVKILLLEFLNEDHILHFFSAVQRFFFLQTVHTLVGIFMSVRVKTIKMFIKFAIIISCTNCK